MGTLSRELLALHAQLSEIESPLGKIAQDEMDYVDRQIDEMWFALRQADGKPVDKTRAAEWAKHTRNAYLRMARRLDAAQRAQGAADSSAPCVARPTQPKREWMRCKTCGSVCDAKALGYRVCDGDPVTGDRNCKMEPYDPNGERNGA